MNDRSKRCSTCGRPRGLEEPRKSWSDYAVVQVPRTENPEDVPWQTANDLICAVSVYRNGGADEGAHLCNECLRVGLRAIKVQVSKLLAELDADHSKDAELAALTDRLARLQLRHHNVCFDHDRMQGRLRDLLAHKSESADPHVVSVAEFEAGRPPAMGGANPGVPR